MAVLHLCIHDLKGSVRVGWLVRHVARLSEVIVRPGLLLDEVLGQVAREPAISVEGYCRNTFLEDPGFRVRINGMTALGVDVSNCFAHDDW